MKKIYLILALMLGISTSVIAAPGDGSGLPLTIKPTNPDPLQNPFPKSPILIPEVYLDGNVLSFDESLEGCTVQLLDEDEAVVFSHFIGENETSVTFPTTLTDTYELQIVCGSITFYCYIEL